MKVLLLFLLLLLRMHCFSSLKIYWNFVVDIPGNFTYAPFSQRAYYYCLIFLICCVSKLLMSSLTLVVQMNLEIHSLLLDYEA